jgi:uncharacterized damage-inducible protein DinB
MTTSLLSDAFAHHIWATERLIEACSVLSPERLTTPVPGTYGSIIGTLRHLVSSDSWYLSFYSSEHRPVRREPDVSLGELASVIRSNGSAWMELLKEKLDPDADVVDRGDGWEFHAPMGLRLAQVIQHGTDHRSQVCTCLTTFGVTPPEIDLWGFGAAMGRTREA